MADQNIIDFASMVDIREGYASALPDSCLVLRQSTQQYLGPYPAMVSSGPGDNEVWAEMLGNRVGYTVSLPYQRLWGPSQPVTVGMVAISLDTGHAARCSVAGVTGSTEPTWLAEGQTVSDGSASWLMVPLTTGYDVTLKDRLRFNGHTADILDITGGQSYQFNISILCVERTGTNA